MKERTQKLLDQIANNHDWIEGQVYSAGGTELHSTDICQVCNLRRHWKQDPQNNVPSHYRFSRGDSDIAMPQALDCQ